LSTFDAGASWLSLGSEELSPERFGFAGRDLQPEHLAMALGFTPTALNVGLWITAVSAFSAVRGGSRNAEK
jgi:hypothetical protein